MCLGEQLPPLWINALPKTTQLQAWLRPIVGPHQGDCHLPLTGSPWWTVSIQGATEACEAETWIPASVL